jgi:hypothetical protein
MASSIPKERRRDLAAAYVAKSLKCALFTSLGAYDPLTATTYTALAAIAPEVNSSGTGYTTGGVALTGKTSAYLAGNGAIMYAEPTSLSAATFTARYGVIYVDAVTPSDKIEAVIDFGVNYTVTNGTFTITWDTVNGIFNIQ